MQLLRGRALALHTSMRREALVAGGGDISRGRGKAGGGEDGAGRQGTSTLASQLAAAGWSLRAMDCLQRRAALAAAGGGTHLRRGDGGGLDDLDAGRAHAVAAAHLLVHLLHSAVQGGVTVLLVRVVEAGTAAVQATAV